MPNEYPSTLRQPDEARTDFALVSDDIHFLQAQVAAAIPTRNEIWRLALLAMLRR